MYVMPPEAISMTYFVNPIPMSNTNTDTSQIAEVMTLILQYLSGTSQNFLLYYNFVLYSPGKRDREDDAERGSKKRLEKILKC
jgi:hypothetical protein